MACKEYKNIKPTKNTVFFSIFSTENCTVHCLILLCVGLYQFPQKDLSYKAEKDLFCQNQPKYIRIKKSRSNWPPKGGKTKNIGGNQSGGLSVLPTADYYGRNIIVPHY